MSSKNSCQLKDNKCSAYFIVFLFIVSPFWNLILAQNVEKYTLIPDVNFELALRDFGYDRGEIDGRVLTSDIAKVKELYIKDRGIRDLTGI